MSQDTFGLAVSDTRLPRGWHCSGALAAPATANAKPKSADLEVHTRRWAS